MAFDATPRLIRDLFKFNDHRGFMKHHLLLSIPSRLLPAELDFADKSAVKSLNLEMKATLKKLLKNKKEHHDPELYYLFCARSLFNLILKINHDDEIIIHGEGYPFLVGPNELGPYTVTAKHLAELIATAMIPDMNLRIQLLTCNSATSYEGSNFARDLSSALYYFYGYKNISVSGYTGFIEVKSNAKYTVTSTLSGRLTKGTHASLSDAVRTYKNGLLIQEGGTVLIESLSGIGDSWAGFFINKTKAEREEVTLARSLFHLRER